MRQLCGVITTHLRVEMRWGGWGWGKGSSWGSVAPKSATIPTILRLQVVWAWAGAAPSFPGPLDREGGRGKRRGRRGQGGLAGSSECDGIVTGSWGSSQAPGRSRTPQGNQGPSEGPNFRAGLAGRLATRSPEPPPGEFQVFYLFISAT
jgi:hypothetical protein